MRKTILILLLSLFAYSCGDQANDNKATTIMTDKIGRVYYAASTPCKAGDYSLYPTGVKSVTIECNHNDKLSKQVIFPDLKDLSNYNSPLPVGEILYRADGSRKSIVAYYPNSKKASEVMYSADGETRISESTFRPDGTLMSRSSVGAGTTFYQADGTTPCPTPTPPGQGGGPPVLAPPGCRGI